MQHEAFAFTGVSNAGFSADVTFDLVLGGLYNFGAHATWGGGSLKLQVLGPDNATYLDLFGAYDASAAEQNEPINTLTADGVLSLWLAPGSYRLHVATATAIFASVARAPTA